MCSLRGFVLCRGETCRKAPLAPLHFAVPRFRLPLLLGSALLSTIAAPAFAAEPDTAAAQPAPETKPQDNSSGGTGLVGTLLVKKLRERGDQVVVLSRRHDAAQQLGEGIAVIAGDPVHVGPWMDAVARANASTEPSRRSRKTAFSSSLAT